MINLIERNQRRRKTRYFYFPKNWWGFRYTHRCKVWSGHTAGERPLLKNTRDCGPWCGFPCRVYFFTYPVPVALYSSCYYYFHFPGESLRGHISCQGYIATEWQSRDSQEAQAIKDVPANAGDVRDAGSIPGLGRSLRGGHSNPLQYPCLESPMHRGAWQAMVHGVTQSQTGRKRLSAHAWWSQHAVCEPPGLQGTRISFLLPF